MSQAPPAPRNSVPRRRWRFSLRGLLVLVLISAVIFAGLGWRWRRAQRQAAIVEALRKTGVAHVMYDYEVHTSDEGDLGRVTIVPQWLRRVLGEDFFSDVHDVTIGPASRVATQPPDGWKPPLGGRAVSESQCRRALRIAASLTQIRSLYIQDAVVRQEALEQLTCWEQLSDLRIDGCDVRDEDLAPLSRAVNVRSLHLHRQPIGDAALVHLRPMRKLNALGLGLTDVTDKGLNELASFPDLEELWLFQTAVTDAGMPHVGRCPKLQFLELSATSVGDEGARYLAGLLNLSYLNLINSRVTDAGVAQLAPLTKLEQGLFGGTTVTQEGVNKVPSLVKSGSYLLGQPATPASPQANAASPDRAGSP